MEKRDFKANRRLSNSTWGKVVTVKGSASSCNNYFFGSTPANVSAKVTFARGSAAYVFLKRTRTRIRFLPTRLATCLSRSAPGRSKRRGVQQHGSFSAFAKLNEPIVLILPFNLAATNYLHEIRAQNLSGRTVPCRIARPGEKRRAKANGPINVS